MQVRKKSMKKKLILGVKCGCEAYKKKRVPLSMLTTNFFTDFFVIWAIDFAEKEGVLVN